MPTRSLHWIVTRLLLVVSSNAQIVKRECYGDFTESCWLAKVDATGMMTAACNDMQNHLQHSRLNLNDHIANINGALYCNVNGDGNFKQTCGRVSFEFPSGRLSAVCRRPGGAWAPTSSLDLNSCIANME
ncbi:hypothetical protein KP509_11G021200 [Ceratopteris richardii]|uniref:Cyanovirin-N domain-containing protein n=1 Tax=Ceratopteris richardii TaxID=49495 RepID=A0A8T2TQJ5_CERRI|nr:hypothetical protein KP509_11G021200 [Ceratopteris richardii]